MDSILIMVSLLRHLQNLKDFARTAGPVIYTNVDRMNPTEG